MAEGVIIGKTDDGQDAVLTYDQRRQGSYVIGVNGTGKTTLLRQIACSDMLQEPKHGLCVIDPHGDLIDDILALVPENRLDDVILFDPSDEENPFCLNLFAPVPAPEEIGRVASEIVAIFRKIFGGAWTPEIEGVIQNATLTLLCRPRDFPLAGKPWTPALDEIPALLAMEMVPEEDRGKPPWKRNVTTYRSQFYQLLQEQDQIPVWEFWNYSFDPLTPRPRSELTFAVLNQVRRLLANPVVRNIVGQTESKLDLSDVMNDGKILLVKLSKGLLGEANSAFLGSVIVAKLVVAVFARAAPPSEERKPFHIIVDEFQNFAISSFPTLLSEARKYGVDLVVAHQYRDQLRDWVQGATENAANTICFRVGGGDALELAREFDATPPPGPAEMEPLYRRWISENRMPGYEHEPSDGEPLYEQRPAWSYWEHTGQTWNSKAKVYHHWYVQHRGSTLYRRTRGRPRPYSDVYQEIANGLTHLPNFHALAKLSGSDSPPLECGFRTTEWPAKHENAIQRQKRQQRNRQVVSKNTVRDFTRPRKDVVAKFKARYETMLRSIGMSWSPDEPLPKPQVLYEEDD